MSAHYWETLVYQYPSGGGLAGDQLAGPIFGLVHPSQLGLWLRRVRLEFLQVERVQQVVTLLVLALLSMALSLLLTLVSLALLCLWAVAE